MQRETNNNKNVVSMTHFTGDKRFPAMAEVEAYWEGIRSGRTVPTRSDIDPRGIENALEYAFILERIAPGLARLRIAGMHLSDLMGMEVRGMPISSFITPTTRTGFSETLETVLNTPAVAKLSLTAECGIGKPPLEGRMLLCPLQSDMGEISRVLGCFSTNGQIGRGPRRFNVMQTELRELPATRYAPTFRTPEPQAREFSETRRQFETRTEPDKRPGYLRLIKTDSE